MQRPRRPEIGPYGGFRRPRDPALGRAMMWALMAPLIPLLRRRVPLGAVGAIDSRDATTLHSLAGAGCIFTSRKNSERRPDRRRPTAVAQRSDHRLRRAPPGVPFRGGWPPLILPCRGSSQLAATFAAGPGCRYVSARFFVLCPQRSSTAGAAHLGSKAPRFVANALPFFAAGSRALSCVVIRGVAGPARGGAGHLGCAASGKPAACVSG